MTGERLFVRCTLTALCVASALVMLVPMVLLKMGEGIYVSLKLTASSITQIWAARGVPGLDK